uniref:(northern house mosquito) hypothetical protein n=1 Tax=Culex pipiens TaxID=7175 RepID=A0A8D8G0W5_CULPI
MLQLRAARLRRHPRPPLPERDPVLEVAHPRPVWPRERLARLHDDARAAAAVLQPEPDEQQRAEEAPRHRHVQHRVLHGRLLQQRELPGAASDRVSGRRYEAGIVHVHTEVGGGDFWADRCVWDCGGGFVPVFAPDAPQAADGDPEQARSGDVLRERRDSAGDQRRR